MSLVAILSAVTAAAAALPQARPADLPQALRQAGVVCSFRPEKAARGPARLLRPEDGAAARPRSLGDLPKADMHLAVNRTIGGCAVPTIVRYAVD